MNPRRPEGGSLATLLLAAAMLGLGFLAGSWTSGAHPESPPAAPPPTAASTLWTCSMHPQIQLPQPGSCPLCGMDLIPLEADEGGDLDPGTFTMSEAAKQLARVQTAVVERRRVTREVQMVGKVDYDETRVEDITARFPGRLDRLYVDYTGVPVRAGDHLAYIYSPELLTAQQELLQGIRATKDLGASQARFLRETTEATVAASREKLRLWGLTPEQIQGIERSGKASDHLTIYAHQSGVVVQKHAVEGAYVMEGSKIYTVADLTHLWVNLDAYESDLAWVRYGQQVAFETEAYPGETFEGRIAFIHPVLDERTRTVKLRVNVANPAGRLKPGMFVRGRVHAEMLGEGRIQDRALAGKWISPMHPEIVKDAPGLCDVCGMPLVRAESLGFVGAATEGALPLVVPATAPLRTGRRALVYVEVPGRAAPTYEGRVVTLGPRAGEYYLVKAGLEVGERVVVEGNFKIDSAVQLLAGPSMMTLPSEGAEAPADLSGSAFLGALSRLTGRLAAIAGALAAGDSDAASKSFEALKQALEALPLAGLEGPRLARATALQGQLVEDAQRGFEAWETPEQRDALLRIGQLVQDTTGPTHPEGDERATLAKLQTFSLGLATHLAADDLVAARELVGTSPLLGLLRPAPGTTHPFALERWQLFLILQALADAATLEDLREAFAVLSDQLLALRHTYPELEQGGQFLSCPMAFSGRGARWLQAQGPVANPYFGAAMLRCGEAYAPDSKGR